MQLETGANQIGNDDDGDQKSIMDQDAYFFGIQEGGSSADFSSSIIKNLRIKDFADAVTVAKNIQLKHPVCFECFDEILK
jgi:hypothetical protein